MHIPELLNHPVVFKQFVAWGDMDAYRHVNNVEYYRYCENARIAYFDLLALQRSEILTVVASSSCRYLKPVVYPDTLHIGVRIEEIRTSAFRMAYKLYSEQQQDIVADAETVMVCVQADTLQKIDIPSQLKDKMIEIENNFNHTLLLSGK